MKSLLSRILTSVLCAACLLSFAQPASATVRPYAASGGAQFISPTEFIGSGQATHLGYYSEEGTVIFSPSGTPGVLSVVGSIIYTAANGDELHASVEGELNTANGAVTAVLTYVGGTGRFAQATGQSNLAGQALPDGSMIVGVQGAIDY